MKYQKCRKCNKIKLISEFRKNKNKKSGYDTICKKCDSKQRHKLGYTQSIKEQREKNQRLINSMKNNTILKEGLG